jgi:NADPH2:quinone reductase
MRERSTVVLSELARLVAAGQLNPLVTEIRPHDAADEALALVEDGHAAG